MSKKRISFISCLIIFAIGGGSLLVHILSKDNDKFFLEKMNSIEKITLVNVTHSVTLTEEESWLLKHVILSQFNEGTYQREKMDNIKTSVFLMAHLLDKKLPIIYVPQTKQLYFESIWFIPDNLDKDEVGEYIFKTKGMILTISDEIDKILIQYGLIVE